MKLKIVVVALLAAAAVYAQTSIRVNAGGPAYTDQQGNVWAADANTAGATYSTGAAIAGTADGPLYQTERYGALDYVFTVPNGTYTVNLKFAEIFFTAPGQRVFSVAINGATVESALDIVAARGANAALDRTYNVNVTGGNIDIKFGVITDNPKVSAIDIEPAAAAPPPPPATTVDATALVYLQQQMASFAQQIQALQAIVDAYTACATVPAATQATPQ